MEVTMKWTIADLDIFPDDGRRYEIIDGDLHVSKQPHSNHQIVCTELGTALSVWNRKHNAGRVIGAPGIIFAIDDAVVPDLVWISHSRLQTAWGEDGKLHAAPELVVEILSPGELNERRDRELKLRLYSHRGVLEYWVLDWRARQIEVYRRAKGALRLVATLYNEDMLTSPHLPGFTCQVSTLFEYIIP